MSYIRCLSNPEALYIWGDADGFANICHNVKPPLSSPWPKDGNTPLFQVPIKAFEKAALRWYGSGKDDVTIDGFRVQMVSVFVKTGMRVPKNLDILTDRRRHELLVRISYKRHFVHLWDVTWAYVVRSVEAHQPFHKPRKK